MRFKLFTTQFCHNCPPMKELLSSQDKMEGEFVNASTPEGLAIAREFKVAAVPTVIFVDDNGTEIKRTGNREEVKAILNEV